MIIYTHQRSKKRKPTAKERQLAADWQALVQKTKISTKAKAVKPKLSNPTLTYKKNDIPSRDSGFYNTFRKADQFYTGDKMKGIGTLHKSNAVPIFTDEEAKDQAAMRR